MGVDVVPRQFDGIDLSLAASYSLYKLFGSNRIVSEFIPARVEVRALQRERKLYSPGSVIAFDSAAARAQKS